METKFAAAIVLLVISFAAAEVAHIRKCEGDSQSACTVDVLRISPCTKNPCPLKKGRNASLSFDFTPKFAAGQLKTAVYWADDPSQTPFSTLGIADGCLYVLSCPVAADQQNTLTYSLYLGKKLPAGKFWLRWKLWNADDEIQVCCLETQVELRK